MVSTVIFTTFLSLLYKNFMRPSPEHIKSVVQNKNFTRIHWSVSRKPRLLTASVWVLLPILFLGCRSTMLRLSDLPGTLLCADFLMVLSRAQTLSPVLLKMLTLFQVLPSVSNLPQCSAECRSSLCFHCCGKNTVTKSTLSRKVFISSYTSII